MNNWEAVKEFNFLSSHVRIIKTESKKTTWRKGKLDDISPGDIIRLRHNSSTIAYATVEWVKVTKVGSISDEDEEYHEHFDTPVERLEEMRRYYNMENGLDEIVTVIRFTIKEEYKQ